MRLAFKTPIGRLGRIRALCVLVAFGALTWIGLQTWRSVHHGGPSAAAARPNAPDASGSGAGTTATPAGPPQQASLTPLSTEVLVERNDTLDRIFRRLQLSLADLASMRGLPGIKTDLDRLRPGETLTFKSRDGALVGLERRLSLSQILEITRSDSGFEANVRDQPVQLRIRTIAGTIDSSLFEAVTAAGAHDSTAMGLSDIFGWDIDFVLDIHPGDSFIVTYQEILRNGAYLKDGPILAARFVNQGHVYLAVRYVAPDGRADYYTPDGRAMRKQFRRAPLEFTRVSSGFSLHRQHPILNLIRAHKGIDYAAPIGTPVHAAGDGRIAFAGVNGGYGNEIEIDHSRGIVTVYGHLSRFASGIRVGRHVQQGEVIAYVGMTGLATGPHLHYEYRVNGVHQNPATVPLPAAVPIEGELREDFLAKTRPLLAPLEAPLGPALVAR
jgi:murein DD-endopeptidase MepM/ murein hydrolase activator NlpD